MSVCGTCACMWLSWGVLGRGVIVGGECRGACEWMLRGWNLCIGWLQEEWWILKSRTLVVLNFAFIYFYSSDLQFIDVVHTYTPYHYYKAHRSKFDLEQLH